MDNLSNQVGRIAETVAAGIKPDLQRIEEAQRKENVKLAEQLQTQASGVSTELKRLQDSYELKLQEERALTQQAVDAVAERLGNEIASLQKEASRIDLGGELAEELKSPGAAFVGSAELKAYIANGKRGKSAGCSINLGRKDAILRDMAVKSLSGVASLRDFMSTNRMLEIMQDPLRMGRVSSLFRVYPTSVRTIAFLRESAHSNLSSTVAEEGLKPESSITFTDDNMPVQTIATWMPVNNQVLDDLPALQAYIENRLVEMLEYTEDNQLLYGDGIAPNLQGIMTHPDVPTFNWSQGGVGDTRIDAIRRAITIARLQEYPVNGVVLHPNDWEAIELQKDDESRYIWGAAPGMRVEPTVWRVPVVETTAILEGDFLAGAFGNAAAIFDRGAATIRVADQHSDFFTHNKTVILIEKEEALVVFRPKAFVIGGFDHAATS